MLHSRSVLCMTVRCKPCCGNLLRRVGSLPEMTCSRRFFPGKRCPRHFQPSSGECHSRMRRHCSVAHVQMKGIQARLVMTGMAAHACWSALPDAFSEHTKTRSKATPSGWSAISLRFAQPYDMHGHNLLTYPVTLCQVQSPAVCGSCQ